LVRVRSDELSVGDQMRIFERSTVVIGMHGAGLANILFCAPGTHVVELLPVR
jgi:capsular polysaccharide biosynthesis protein